MSGLACDNQLLFKKRVFKCFNLNTVSSDELAFRFWPSELGVLHRSIVPLTFGPGLDIFADKILTQFVM
jgi:hypothetical protein